MAVAVILISPDNLLWKGNHVIGKYVAAALRLKHIYRWQTGSMTTGRMPPHPPLVCVCVLLCIFRLYLHKFSFTRPE